MKKIQQLAYVSWTSQQGTLDLWDKKLCHKLVAEIESVLDDSCSFPSI